MIDLLVISQWFGVAAISELVKCHLVGLVGCYSVTDGFLSLMNV